MARDPLATLARLRKLAVNEAKRDLAEALAAEDAALARATAAEAALTDEAETADPAAYAAWLPRGLAEARAEAAKAEAAARAAERQRLLLAEARAAERAVELLADKRAAEAAKAADRRAQAMLDEAAQSVRRFRSEGGRRR
jgi:flagellar biosynthesis chaperone FliJ